MISSFPCILIEKIPYSKDVNSPDLRSLVVILPNVTIAIRYAAHVQIQTFKLMYQLVDLVIY